MIEMSEEALDRLKQIAQSQEALVLLNEYKGVPVSYGASIRRVEGPTAIFKVHKYQAVCLTVEGKTKIQCRPLALAVAARAATVDVIAGTATLTDFRPAIYTTERKQAVRVKPNLPVTLEVLPDKRIVAGRLESLSQSGMGIYLPPTEIAFDPRAVFQSGMALNLRVQLPTEEAPIEVTGTVARGLQQEGVYTLAINLVMADAEAQRALSDYIAQRRAAIAQELQTAYEQLCAAQSKQPRR
ncbi:MAG: PilZ protein [Anaerolineales bacterium]|nr:PilZ protein [Anaerolineales bacterium]